MAEKASQTNGKTGVWGAFLLGLEQKNKNWGIESLEVFTYLFLYLEWNQASGTDDVAGRRNRVEELLDQISRKERQR